MRLRPMAGLLVLAAIWAGCGSGGESEEGRSEVQQQAAAATREARQDARRLAARRRASALRRARAEARREATRRKARRQAMRQRAQARAEEAERAETEEAEAEEAASESECDPNYSGACLDPYASDYDCAGGSGDGPEYTGPVTVVGEDHYGLDSDSDGSACET